MVLRNALFGVWLNPVAALVHDPAEREAVASELRRVLVDGEDAVAERVETIDAYVPAGATQAARLVDRVLKGANPAVMPIEFLREFELAVNLKTARAIGVTIPEDLLLRAVTVIR